MPAKVEYLFLKNLIMALIPMVALLIWLKGSFTEMIWSLLNVIIT